MAKYFAINNFEVILGVIAERTSKGDIIPKENIICILADYYNVTIDDVELISEETSYLLGGYCSGWTDSKILDDYCRGFKDNRVCLLETGMNYPEVRDICDRWYSGRQFKVKDWYLK